MRSQTLADEPQQPLARVPGILVRVTEISTASDSPELSTSDRLTLRWRHSCSQTRGMKRRDLLKALDAQARQAGLELELVRHGGSHDIYRIGDCPIPIPRHNEIPEGMARAIIRAARRYAEGGTR